MIKEKFIINNFLILLIAFISIIPYIQTLNFGFNIDDPIYTTANQATNFGLKRSSDFFKFGSMRFVTGTELNSGSYRPITLLSFGMEKQLFGSFNPRVGHSINLILYFLQIYLIGMLLMKVFQNNIQNTKYVLFILILYALHPSHVEVVASIKSRDSLLSAIFGISSLILWFSNLEKFSVAKIVTYTLLFLLATFSKEEALVYFPMTLLISYYYKEFSLQTWIKYSLPLVGCTIAYFIIRNIVLDDINNSAYSTFLNNIIYGSHKTERFATNFYIYLYYIKLLLFPIYQSWDYSYAHIKLTNLLNGWVWISIVFFGYAIYYALKKVSTKSKLAFGILWYFISFSIYSNAFDSITIGSTLAERFVFVPSLGFLIAFVFILESVSISLFKNNNYYQYVFVGIISIFYFIRSFSYSQKWENTLTLSEYAIKISPKSWRVHKTYADELRLSAITDLSSQGNQALINIKFKQSIYEYKEALKIIDEKVNVGILRLGLAESFLYLKDTTAAINQYKLNINKSSDIENNRRKYYLGKVLYEQKKYSEALDFLLEEEPIYSSNPNSYEYSNYLNSCAICLLKVGKTESAKQYFNKSFDLYSDNYIALLNLGFLELQGLPNHTKSIIYFEKALNTTNADNNLLYINLGSVYTLSKQKEKAITAFENALKFGKNKNVYGNLSLLYKEMGNFQKSKEYEALYFK